MLFHTNNNQKRASPTSLRQLDFKWKPIKGAEKVIIMINGLIHQEIIAIINVMHPALESLNI